MIVFHGEQLRQLDTPRLAFRFLRIGVVRSACTVGGEAAAVNPASIAWIHSRRLILGISGDLVLRRIVAWDGSFAQFDLREWGLAALES